jgi:hypothetical protein
LGVEGVHRRAIESDDGDVVGYLDVNIAEFHVGSFFDDSGGTGLVSALPATER